MNECAHQREQPLFARRAGEDASRGLHPIGLGYQSGLKFLLAENPGDAAARSLLARFRLSIAIFFFLEISSKFRLSGFLKILELRPGADAYALFRKLRN